MRFTDPTPIPEGFPVKHCDPGAARGIEPVLCRSTGRAGAPECLFRDAISEALGSRPKPLPEPMSQEKREKWIKNYQKNYQTDYRAKKKAERTRNELDQEREAYYAKQKEIREKHPAGRVFFTQPYKGPIKPGNENISGPV